MSSTAYHCTLLLLIVVSTLLVTAAVSSGTKTCKEHEILFMEKCWCEPGWESSSDNEEKLQCDKAVLKHDDCDCLPEDTKRAFLTDNEWQHPKGYRCTSLCRYNTQLGVPRSLPSEWKDNQLWKQLPFYRKDLPKKNHNHLIERLDEFATAYQQWHFLNHTNLGNVLELGAGGYTQLRNILQRTEGVKVQHVTLLDPQILEYKVIPGCTFGSGQFKVHNKEYPTVLINDTVEHFGTNNPSLYGSFDTIVVMNVLVYSQDAFLFLETIYKMLKPNGLLLFHDRWFENHAVSSKCKTAGFFVNVLQVSKTMLDHFLSFFDHKPFFSTERTPNQISRSSGWCRNTDKEQAFFVAVHKK